MKRPPLGFPEPLTSACLSNVGIAVFRRLAGLWIAVCLFSVVETVRLTAGEPSVHDLSLLVAPEMPCTWPEMFPQFQINHYWRSGDNHDFNVDILTMDLNTGTQIDVPPHSIAMPDSGLPSAGPFGTLFSEKVPVAQLCGEACVIDCADLLDSAPNGRSDLVTRERIIAWEKEHRPLRRGDVVLIRSGYSDKYYQPLPAGSRFIADPFAGRTPAWPDPDPECMEYLATRGVMHVGTDSPSMGPIPLLAEPTHRAGLKHGMVFTEGLTNLAGLPATGAFYCAVGPKHINAAGCEARALAIFDSSLADRLIKSSRNEHVVDLSVTLTDNHPVWWPGTGRADQLQRYLTVTFGYNPNVNAAFQTHILDSHTGTHLVSSGSTRASGGDDDGVRSKEYRSLLADYEKEFGARGTNSKTVESIPLSQTCGEVRVIDVSSLRGATDQSQWPASPEIGVDPILKYEEQAGKLQSGQVVLFRTNFTDDFFRPLPEGSTCFSDPLLGKSEGWPALGPKAVHLLAERGIRCVGIDAPTLGGVDSSRALKTYWALASHDMVGVEFLISVKSLPDKAYFIFAPVKIKGCHGGPGRAIALY